MPINYIEKSFRLHREVSEQGHSLSKLDGEWVSSDDVEVQAIIDSYDALAEAQADARARVAIEASKRVAAIYPFINPEKEEALGLYQFTADLLTHLNATAGLTGNLATFQAIRSTAQAKIAEINALTTWEECDDYNETTGWE
jgi:hypothetical protein